MMYGSTVYVLKIMTIHQPFIVIKGKTAEIANFL